MAHHEGLGKVLAALEGGTCLGGADDGDGAELSVVTEVVVDALDQRILGTYDDHVDIVLEHEGLDALEVGGRERHILTYFARAGIAGSDIQFLYFRTLAYLPSQGMLASATAQ